MMLLLARLIVLVICAETSVSLVSSDVLKYHS